MSDKMTNSTVKELKIDETGETQRIDRFISDTISELSRQYVVELIASGNILVGGKIVKKNYKLKSGDTISIDIPEPEEISVEAEDIPLDILYEDEDVIVVNKGKGMAVHPAPGNYEGTLVNALLFHCKDLSGINGKMRPGIVHRIDKDTTGVMVVAKNDEAHRNLAEQFKDHEVERLYTALVYEQMEEKAGRIEAPIGRDPRDRKRMAVNHKNGKPATTHYRVVKRYPGFTLVELKLETGRTHQIRVHLAYIKHPLVGDTRYTRRKNTIGDTGEQMLHAGLLAFTHPRTGEWVHFEAPLPEYFQAIIDQWKYLEEEEQDNEGLSD